MNSARWIGLLTTLLIGGVIGAFATFYIISPHAAGESEDEGSAPTAAPIVPVQTAKLMRQSIEQTVTAYGTVTTAVGEAHTLSVPFECIVNKVLVNEGQAVDKGQPLLTVEPSPDTKLQLQQAIGDRDTAKSQLDLVEQRVKLKLATQADQVTAQQAYNAAAARVTSLQQRGIDGERTLKADEAGLISQLAARQGQIVAPGSMLAETIGEHQITVRLGVESDIVPLMKVGQTIHITPVNAATDSGVDGKVHLISRSVNPQTRLVDVFVTPSDGAKLLLNQYVSGRIVVSSAEALTAPRSAVLPEQGRYHLFTVADGKAREHTVKLGIESDKTVQVLGDDLKAGDMVVVTGNYELSDGMAVKTGSEK